MNRLSTCLVLLSCLFFISAQAADKPEAIKKQIKSGLYLTASEAYALKKKGGDNVLFVDIRTPSELVFVGTPKDIDINIPFITMNYKQWDFKKRNYKKTPNPHFVSEFESFIKSQKQTKDIPVILLCRSGSRSAKAANLLSSNGYQKIYTIVDGFEGDKSVSKTNKGKRVVNGWKNNDLPWTYQLDEKKMSTIN